MTLNVTGYDHIVLPDQFGALAGQSIWQYMVYGSFGAGMKIIVKQNGQQISFACVDGDTADTVAQKIAAQWNKIYPSDFNTTAPRNEMLNVVNPITATYPNMVQLFSPSSEQFVFEYELPVQPTATVTEPVKNNWGWWLGGGLLLLLLARKKKKNKA